MLDATERTPTYGNDTEPVPFMVASPARGPRSPAREPATIPYSRVPATVLSVRVPATVPVARAPIPLAGAPATRPAGTLPPPVPAHARRPRVIARPSPSSRLPSPPSPDWFAEVPRGRAPVELEPRGAQVAEASSGRARFAAGWFALGALVMLAAASAVHAVTCEPARPAAASPLERAVRPWSSAADKHP